MATAAQLVKVSKGKLWTGWILSVIPIGMLAFSAFLKLTHPPQVIQGFEHFGWPASLLVKLGILELLCAVIYAIPRTAVFGAILVTGYLGGATATNVRILDPTFFMPVLLGVFAWLGLYLREPRLHALVPLRK